MADRLSTEPFYKHPDEAHVLRIDMQHHGLENGETMTGTVTLTVPSGITADNASVNVATFTNAKGGTCPIGKGLLLRVAGGTAGQQYSIVASAAKSGSPSQVITIVIPIYVMIA